MARPEDQRVDQERVLVDEAMPPQEPDELAAPENHEILARLLLEPGHGNLGVAPEQRGVDPRQRLGQR